MTSGVQLGLKLKQTGMSLAAAKRMADLEEARAFLVRLAMLRGTREVSADDLYCGHPDCEEREYRSLGNAAGSLFKCAEWEWTGRFKESIVPSRHAGLIRIWRLK